MASQEEFEKRLQSERNNPSETTPILLGYLASQRIQIEGARFQAQLAKDLRESSQRCSDRKPSIAGSEAHNPQAGYKFLVWAFGVIILFFVLLGRLSYISEHLDGNEFRICCVVALVFSLSIILLGSFVQEKITRKNIIRSRKYNVTYLAVDLFFLILTGCLLFGLIR